MEANEATADFGKHETLGTQALGRLNKPFVKVGQTFSLDPLLYKKAPNCSQETYFG
jgi:hypothetical protein